MPPRHDILARWRAAERAGDAVAFERLRAEYAAVDLMSEPYRPPKYSQIDGSRFQNSNCVLAVTTDLIDRVTVGALRIQAPTLRVISGDTSGGVTHSQAAAAAYKATKGVVTLTPRVLTSRQQLRDLADAGIPFGLFGSAYVPRDTRFRTGTYTGLHEYYGQDIHHGSSSFLLEDPGTTAAGYMWWPEDLVFRTAERAGGGRIYVLTGRDTEGTERKCAATGRIRGTPDVDGVDKGPLVVGKTYWVSKTVNGGWWKRADGGQSNGWHRIDGGWVMGRKLR